MSKLGRRELGADTRGALLQASTELILENGIGDTPLRDIARRANVNQAMVRYHFTDKSGLLKATLDFGFERLLEHLSENADFETTITSLISWIRQNPWLVSLMMKSVFGGNDLRNHFLITHAPRLLDIYKTAMKTGQSDGQVRDDLDPKFIVSSLVSLVVFPVLAAPVLDEILNASPDDMSKGKYVSELLKLFSPQGEANE